MGAFLRIGEADSGAHFKYERMCDKLNDNKRTFVFVLSTEGIWLKTSPLQTEADIQLVKDHLILTVMLDMLEIEVRKLRRGDLHTSALLARQFRKIQKETQKELYEVHRSFRKNGIRIVETARTKGYVEARYLCRGYEHEMMLLGDTVKASIEVRLADRLDIDLDADEDA
jgi:hypothetical protein